MSLIRNGLKKWIYFAPAIITALLAIAVVLADGFDALVPVAWVWIPLLFGSGILMYKGKWYGCLGGIAVGCTLIWMSTVDTGQIIPIERPAGVILCIYYAGCGIVVQRW